MCFLQAGGLQVGEGSFISYLIEILLFESLLTAKPSFNDFLALI